ncbi:MAG: TrbI/VirB10 family protein [Bryobacteraceae bacterium]
MSESKSATPIESPSGVDLHPKPPNPVRVSKRAGALIFIVGTLILGLFAYGAYRRQNLQRAAVADFGSKSVAPATSAGAEIAKEIPSGSVPLSRSAAAPPATPGNNLVPPEEVKALANMPMPPTGEHVIVRQPAMPYGAPAYGAQLEPPRTPSPAEQERAAALAREQQAMVAPTSTRQGSASGWTPDAQAAAPGTGSVTAASLAALANSVAGHNSAAPPQNAGKAQSDYEEQNMQAHKESFVSGARGSQSGDYLPSTRTPPLTQYAIQAGWEIPAVLEQAINSDLPGELKALVMSNVYDTPTGRFLLIPQGSRLIGLYDSHVGYAQDGVQVVWNRIIYPDGSSLDLNGMMGLDSHGNAGLRYDVDHHYKRLVGFAVLTSVFSAAFELSQSRGQSTTQYPSVGQVAGSAVGQEVSQLGEQITRRNLNVQPTIKIPVGYKFNVRVNRDILFDAPYAPLRAAH